MITLLYSRAPTLISRVIRLRFWSGWSHVGILDGDHVIESVPGIGVRRVLIADSLTGCDDWSMVDYPCADPAAVIAIAASQIGKPYDLKGALGLGFNRDWQDDSSWWCSELVAWSFDQAGQPWFRPAALHRITPENLWIQAPIGEFCL